MRFKFIAIAATMLFVALGAMSVYANESTNQAAAVPAVVELSWSMEEISQILTDLLPAFEDFYAYDLVADLERSNLSLRDFAGYLHNYLIAHFLSGTLSDQAFYSQGDNWLLYFVDGVVFEMSQSPVSEWGNISLKGLLLNDIYFQALGTNLFFGFFMHDDMILLANTLEIPAYFDFLIGEDSLEVLLPFGAAARAYLANGNGDALENIVGEENMAQLGDLAGNARVNFLAGLLVELMVPDIEAVIYEYQDFVVIPAANVQVPIQISQTDLERAFSRSFNGDIAILVASEITGANLNIFLDNTGDLDFVMVLHSYDARGEWQVFASEFVAAGESQTFRFAPDRDLRQLLRISILSPDGEEFSGLFSITKTMFGQ
ncbi:MAG: hypothetical protein FWC76_05800 [Defluviitaleaceae bacterium]|nr:hypothetical protein [Defluviitaleaceae bacterium]